MEDKKKKGGSSAGVKKIIGKKQQVRSDG